MNTTLATTKELTFLERTLTDQTSAAKAARWVYKYNILHRKALFSSHTHTLTKRLLNSGFYDSSFFAKNAHAQTLLSSNPNPSDFFKTNFIESYANFVFNASNEGARVTSSNSALDRSLASQISAHEESYFWVLKRFYLFNTLPHLSVVSAPLASSTHTPDQGANQPQLDLSSFKVLQATNLLEYNALMYANDRKASQGNAQSLPAIPSEQDTLYSTTLVDF